METGRLLEKGPHPKTAGPVAEDQKSTLKHLLFTLAIFTGKGRDRARARKRRYSGGMTITWPTHLMEHFIGS